jgi:hypothetical protein
MDLVGWIGNLFIVAGLWGIGSKQRGAFLFSIIGESCYIARSFIRGDWALFFVCWVFLLMAMRGYILWGKNQ